MTTRVIGTKEFRKNMAKIATASIKNNDRLIVLRKNKPIFELRPLDKTSALTESFRLEIDEARKDLKSGDIYSQEEVERKIGL